MFEGTDEPGVNLYAIDGGYIARARYGESEERIWSLFLAAQGAVPGTSGRSPAP